MRNDKTAGLISIAQKAGALASGSYAVEQAVKNGSACLVILAGDASETTAKKVRNMTRFYEVPLCTWADRERLGACIGKEYRSAAAVTQPGLADAIRKQLETVEYNRSVDREEEEWQK